MNDYCVYCHTTPSNKKYIGISRNPIKRWNNGRGYSKNYAFYRAIKKYGWDNIKHEILYDNLSLFEAQEIEERLISDWFLTDRNFGYNLISKIDGKSDETLLRMSSAQKGNKNCKGRILSSASRSKISNSLKTYFSNPQNREKLHRPHSEAAKEKLRKRIFTNDTKAKMKANHYNCSGSNNPSAVPIVQLSKSGEFIKEFAYASLAANECGLDLSSIIKCCKGKSKSCGGFLWKYRDR